MIARAVALLIGLIPLPHPAAAWGASGHAVVAEIAQRRLTPEARRAIEGLIGNGTSLASIANWADTAQINRPETRPWHFVNIPLDANGYEAARDCPEGACIVEALERQRTILADRSASRKARTEALRFVVHLVGDSHQPLHAADNHGDLGGSRVFVSFSGEPTNLHAVWDYKLLDHRGFDWGEHVRRIEAEGDATMDPEPIDEAAFVRWVNESHRLAASSAYAEIDNGTLGPDYIGTRSRIVDRQLGRAGARLARLLNDCLE